MTMNKLKESESQEVNKQPPLIAIVGQSASGKSSLAFKVAKKYGGEIISADSRSIYKYMDIGTAKPSPKQQIEIPHHGLDLVEPNQMLTAAQYQQYALKTIASIRAKNKLPILVGGSGLYIDGVLFNYSFSTPADPKIRRLLNNMSDAELQQLASKRGLSTEKQLLHNRRHLIRQLERGEPTKQSDKIMNNTLVIGLSPDRKVIRDNITKRVELMFKTGLRREVDWLVDKYGWDSEAMTGIGYREFKDYYDGHSSMSKIKQLIIQNTLKLAKKQRTWFKRNRHIEWFENADSAIIRIDDFLASHGYTKA